MSKHRIEKACDTCGYRCFANCRTLICPGAPHAPNCKGTLCSVITPLPGKRVSGVLCRDNEITEYDDIVFFPGESLENARLNSCDIWITKTDTEDDVSTWTLDEWKNQYGKLPRKGSKQMVIIELTDGK